MARKKKTDQSPVSIVPSKTMLDRAKETLDERLKASKKIVNAKKGKWDTWQKMYKNEQLSSRITGESNLVLPKADYIAEVISSKVINSIFSVATWLTMKHPKVQPQVLADQQKFFMWVMDRRVNFYLTAIELFKSSPVKGTSICKVYMRNFWPCIEYLDLESFLPDPMARKPGDIQSMRYCMHQFNRDLQQLKKFVSPLGNPIYINMDKLEAQKEEKKKEAVQMSGTDTSVTDNVSPIFDIVEYHGDFEYENGKFGEYIITGTLKNKADDKTDVIIRCEPSTFKVKDKYSDEDVYLKPFVANIYSVNPGEFYGKSAIASVESLINEQTDLHNIYMDNHKRLVNGITKVLNRADLTRDDLPQTPGAMWYLDNFEDVDVEVTQEVNLLAYKQIHELLDREIEKASSVTAYNLGVGRTKRETFGEVRSMLSEASDRFQLFIQMADRVTLRPVSQLIYALLRETFEVYAGRDFLVDGENITIDKDSLLADMDIQFATTTVESEHSKYSKQQTFPQMLQIFQQIAGGRLNADEIVKVVGELFNFNNPERFLHPSESIPISALPEEVQGIAQQILAQLQEEQTGGTKALPQPTENAPQALGGGMG